MKSKLTILSGVWSLILFSSCHKNAGSDLPTSTDRVKTYTEDITSAGNGHSVTTYNLTYDANNRLTSFVSASDPTFKVTYSYTGTDSYTSDSYSGSDFIREYFYYKSNRIDSTFQYNNTGDTSTEKFLYNGSGLFAKSFEYEYSAITGSDLQNTTTYTSYDANGNLLSSEDTDGNADTYEYYPDLVYIHPRISPALIPVIKRNLIKTHTVTINGSHVGTGTFTYTFDSNNRISTEKTEIDDGSVVIKTYTYY